VLAVVKEFSGFVIDLHSIVMSLLLQLSLEETIEKEIFPAVKLEELHIGDALVQIFSILFTYVSSDLMLFFHKFLEFVIDVEGNAYQSQEN